MNNLHVSSMFDIVKEELNAFEEELHSILKSPVGLIGDIGLHLMQAGGKRLRPALYLICAKARKQTDNRGIIPLAAAIELIHMATLVHDDVIDKAMTRRGKKTANQVWGNHISVLTGDCLFARAFSVIAGTGNNAMLKTLTEVICSMCEGEIVQHVQSFDPSLTEENYLKRIAQKTADFIAASCELGGMSAGMSQEDTAALRQYGYSIGMAFQITDDILDITSSVEQLGKQIGSDLRQGIITLPVIYALANSGHKQELQKMIVEFKTSQERIERGLDIVNDINAIEYAYSHVERYLEDARRVLPQSLPADIKHVLLHIADFIGERKY